MQHLYTFTKELRLRAPAQFKYVFAQPVRSSSHQLTLLARSKALKHARLGLAVSKKVAQEAVKRNRLKRVIREYFRTNQHQFLPLDVVVIPKRGFLKLSPAQQIALLDKLWLTLSRRYNASL